MAYSFRIRVNRCDAISIQSEDLRITISEEGGRSLVIHGETGKMLKDSEQYILVGNGYENEDLAKTEGQKHHDSLMVAFARSCIGVDFGKRMPAKIITEHGLEWAQQQFGIERALKNGHGLMVYETEPDPKFISIAATPVLGKDLTQTVQRLKTAVDADIELTEREQLAFTLFNASFFQATVDTRFILLVMAIEALIESTNLSEESISLVDKFIQETQISDLNEEQINSLAGRLRMLKQESINQAGKRLVTERLGEQKEYSGQSPAGFFAVCYGMRSNLVHGNVPYPTIEDLNLKVAGLEAFVSDLLTAKYFDAEP